MNDIEVGWAGSLWHKTQPMLWTKYRLTEIIPHHTVGCPSWFFIGIRNPMRETLKSVSTNQIQPDKRRNSGQNFFKDVQHIQYWHHSQFCWQHGPPLGNLLDQGRAQRPSWKDNVSKGKDLVTKMTAGAWAGSLWQKTAGCPSWFFMA